MALHDSIVRQVESLAVVPNECLSLPEWEKITGQWKSLAHDTEAILSKEASKWFAPGDGPLPIFFPPYKGGCCLCRFLGRIDSAGKFGMT